MNPVSDPNLLSQLRTRNSCREFKCLKSDSITAVKCTDIHKRRWKHNIIKQSKETQKNQISTSGFAIDSGKSSWHKIFQHIQWADVTV